MVTEVVEEVVVVGEGVVVTTVVVLEGVDLSTG